MAISGVLFIMDCNDGSPASCSHATPTPSTFAVAIEAIDATLAASSPKFWFAGEGVASATGTPFVSARTCDSVSEMGE